MRVETWHPTILEFRFGSWSLGRDLRHLSQVQQVNAPEAVVFYCSRMLEQLTGAAVELTTPEQAATVFSNLRHLNAVRTVRPAHLVYFHTLRILGNAARHIHREVTDADAEIAVHLLERLLSWFFLDLKHGPGLDSLRAEGVAVEEQRGSALTEVLCLFESESPDLETLDALWSGGAGPAFASTPIVSSLYAETLIRGDKQQRPQAFRVLSSALQRFPDDLRLRQLYGWLLRMEGQVEDALDILEQLHREQTNDQETLGLLAGTYKRLWSEMKDVQSRKARHHLRRARDLYLHAWKVSKKKDTYTGINAASTNLFLGHPREARELARAIVSLFDEREQRRQQVQEQTGRQLASFVDYWDEVTLAEAYLLLGRSAQGREAYRNAFEHHRNKPTWHESTLYQLKQLLSCLHLPAEPRRFLDKRPAVLQKSDVRIRMVSLSELTLSDELEARLKEGLSALQRRWGRTNLVLETSLLSPVDCRLAQMWLEQGWSLRVELKEEVSATLDRLTSEQKRSWSALLEQCSEWVLFTSTREEFEIPYPLEEEGLYFLCSSPTEVTLPHGGLSPLQRPVLQCSPRHSLTPVWLEQGDVSLHANVSYTSFSEVPVEPEAEGHVVPSS
jgi:tetratricopeptide (TPR) repeat protein